MTMEETPGYRGLEPAVSPLAWGSDEATQAAFWEAVRKASQPMLICDYDGTLAPFQLDKMQAHPYPGIPERLAVIAAGPTKLAFVSGRPVLELISLLPLAAASEVWGMHGRQHRTPDGRLTLIEPTPAQREALDQAQQQLESEGLDALLERKVGSIALHWRSLVEPGDSARLAEVQSRAQAAFQMHAGRHALALLPFDGGLELRANDYTKAHAATALLSEADPRAAAFLGDDLTDEDAFRVLRARGGLSLLVRDPPRVSEARFSLLPPHGLSDFLDCWIEAIAMRSTT